MDGGMTPTNEEREALRTVLRETLDRISVALSFEEILDEFEEDILSAGFRRATQNEPTDAQVFAAMKEFTRTETAGRLRAMRSALHAALTAEPTA